MIKRALLVLAAIAALAGAGILWAVHYVPSPFATVKLQGDKVLATLRPDARFLVLRSTTQIAEHVLGAETLELRDGESVRLRSPRTRYQIICRTSPTPAGLQVEGEWHYHDFPRSAVKKWFIKAE